MERLLNQDIDKVARKGGTKTGGQLIVPAVATHMGSFLVAHRKARTAV